MSIIDIWKSPKYASEWVLSTARKVSKYVVFSGSYFSVFSPNTEKYGPEKTPYLDTFHTAVAYSSFYIHSHLNRKVALHNIEIACPSLSYIAINTYQISSRIIVMGGAEIQYTKCTTQDDNLAISSYATTTVQIQ